MPVSTAYDYTCRFCSAVNSVFVSLDVALRASTAAANGDHEKARDIVFAQEKPASQKVPPMVINHR